MLRIFLAAMLAACTSETTRPTPEPARIATATTTADSPGAVPTQTVLVELFTSEGCSSCPPAEAVVRDLVRVPPPGTRVLAIEWHVDYWNELGHVDRFSKPAFTARQHDYAEALGSRSLYTPEAVVDGSSEVVGSRADALRELIVARATAPHVAVTFAAARLTVGTLPANVQHARVSIAEIDLRAHTDVTRGENAGLHLQHNWVVTGLSELGPARATGGSFPLPAPTAGRGQVAFVVDAKGHVLGAEAALP